MISSFLSFCAALPVMIVVHLPMIPEEEPSFATDVSKTFEMLKTESPVLYQRLEKMPREKLIRTILTALESGVELKSQQNTADPRLKRAYRKKDNAKFHPARLIDSNSMFYVRIDRIDQDTLNRLAEDVKTAGNIPNKPQGVIIDLRSAKGGDYALCMKYLPFFRTDQKEKTHFQKIPMVILTGFKTNGAPELLAALLGKDKSAMLLGTPGAGKLFPTKEVVFNGKKWLVPQLDAQWDLSTKSGAVDVEFNPYPQIDYDQIGKKDIRTTDDAIRRACDLLKTITVLK